MREQLSDQEQAELLRIARAAIAAKLGALDKGQALTPGSPSLQAACGAFVSLHKQGALRGCIGTFTSQRPLVETVREMAVAAALRDPRFSPMTAAELSGLEIEISVLSPLRTVADPAEIEIGRHGIFITQGLRSGVLLPQVATEYGWDRETFLEHTCLKAGLPRGAWREPRTIIEVFEAQVFGESAAH